MHPPWTGNLSEAMKKTLLILCFPFLVGPPPDEVTRPPGGAASASVDTLAWMAGCWEFSRDDRITLEMWMPAAGDMMLGSSRTQVGGVTREWEHLRIAAEADALVYTAIPSGQQETSFASVGVEEGSVTFENPGHDFPRRITTEDWPPTLSWRTSRDRVREVCGASTYR